MTEDDYKRNLINKEGISTEEFDNRYEITKCICDDYDKCKGWNVAPRVPLNLEAWGIKGE